METREDFIKRADAARKKEFERMMKKRFNAHIKETSQPPSQPPPQPPPQPSDPRPQPARKLTPLPINYQPLRELEKVNFGENRATYLGASPMSLRKPLAPNVLDVAAMDREKELAAQRRKAGHKWVMVVPR